MREKRFQTSSSRWAAEGRVHRMLYSTLNRTWYLDCREISRGMPHGEVVDEDTPITCKLCDPTLSTFKPANAKGVRHHVGCLHDEPGVTICNCTPLREDVHANN